MVLRLDGGEMMNWYDSVYSFTSDMGWVMIESLLHKRSNRTRQ